MRQQTRQWVALGLGILIAVLAITVGVALRKTQVIHDSVLWVAHTHEVLDALERLQLAVTDAETGQRGFVITGDKAYLEPYDKALVEYREKLDRVAELMADNPEQQKRLNALTDVIEQRVDRLKQVVAVRAAGDFDAASNMTGSGRGQQLMTQVRQIADEMRAEERRLLQDRTESDNAAYRSAIAGIFLSAAVGLGSIAGFIVLLRRHLRAVDESAAMIFEQRELLQATLHSIGDGVIATDAEGRVTFMNSVAQNLTGWHSAAAAGQALETVFHIVNEETRAEVENPALRSLREGKVMGLANHTILVARDGTEWPIDDSAAPIRDQAGDLQGAILVFREIRERKQQEHELRRQSAALAEADLRKDEFLATLAHELRNPLAPISNALQIWSMVDNDRAQMDNLRGVMERQVAQMLRLIDDLMDVSRITRGKIQLRRQRVDVNTVIAGAVEAVKPFVESCGHELHTALSPAPIFVDGDVARLTQIFGNILNNAAKYTGRNGKIWIRAGSENGQATVAVRDNGPGIPGPMLEEIFEMFRQVDGTLERAHGGLGIGLTLVKRLTEEHGGAVEARSDGAGKGSEFVVRLPLANGSVEPTASEMGQRPASPAAHPAYRILVVDDVEASAHTLAMMLRAIGQQAETANDGPSAIAWTREHKPDAVFLDIAMPGMNGYDVARELRALQPDLLLVALTGYGQQEDRKAAFDAGFDQHLVKPIGMQVLEQVLQMLAGRRAG